MALFISIIAIYSYEMKQLKKEHKIYPERKQRHES